MNKNNISKNILKIRRNKGLSQKEFAKLLNVDRTTVSKWEHGESNPNLETLILIRNIFNVTIDSLICD